jgi:hypothetical protein
MSFTTKSGQDAYDAGSPLYYVFQVMIWIYSAGYVASLILLQNANVPYKYETGVLYSARFNLYWFSLMFSAMRIFTIVFIC